MNEGIMEKLENNDVNFGHADEMMIQIDRRFDQIGTKLDFLVKKVLEHDDRLERIEENMVTKNDHQEVMNVLDKIVKMHEKMDQAFIFMGSRLRRVEDQTEQNTLDIQKIKPALGLA